MRPETRCAVVLVLTALAAPIPGRGQAPQVAAEFKLDSFLAARVADSATFQQQVATRLARTAGEHFGYLVWKPAHLAAAGDPRVILKVSDGQLGMCGPPAVALTMSVARAGTERELRPKVRFLEACDPSSVDWTESVFLAELQTRIDQLFDTDSTFPSEIENLLLANILLTNSFEPDAAQEMVFLPLKPQDLKADRESIIRVGFGPPPDHTAGEVLLRPQNSVGDRTLVFLQSFRCGAGITSGGPLPETNGSPWHPQFGQLLQSCQGPSVYMKKYVPLGLNGNVAQPPPATAISPPAGTTGGVVLGLGDQS